jgi:hypothetical protein
MNGVELEYLLKRNALSRPSVGICRMVNVSEGSYFWLLRQTFVAVQEAVRRPISWRN